MGSRRSSSSIFFHLPTILLISLRLRSSIAFFFSSGGCSCPACPPPQPVACSSQCGGSCSDGIGGGGYSGVQDLICEQDVPAVARVEDVPAVARVEDVPAVARVEDVPAVARVEDVPAVARVEDVPAVARVEDVPAVARVEDVPAVARLEDVPAVARVEDVPAVARVEDVPAVARVEDVPAVARVEGVPAVARVQDMTVATFKSPCAAMETVEELAPEILEQLPEEEEGPAFLKHRRHLRVPHSKIALQPIALRRISAAVPPNQSQIMVPKQPVEIASLQPLNVTAEALRGTEAFNSKWRTTEMAAEAPICAPSHPSSPGSSSCQPICASNSPSTAAQSPTGAGGTYVHGPAQPVPTPNHPVMPSYPSEPPPVASPFEGNNINNFAAGSNSHHQQNAGAAESAFTTQQQPQLGPQPAAPLPVQPPPPSEPDNQSDRENTAEGIGGGYRDTGLNNGGKEGGLSLLSSKLIRVGGGLSTTTMRSTSVDWDLYEEKLPDLADYETETSIASGGASIGTKNPPVKASNPTTPTTSSTSTSTKSAFYAVRTSSRRGAPQSTSTTTPTTSTTTAAPTSRPTTTRTMMSSSVGENKENNDLLSDDYSENSFKKVHASVKNRNGDKLAPFTSSSSSSSTTVAAEDPKCSSETLRAIMQENIVLSPTISKQLIFSAGRLAFGQSIDVICSKNKFSYTVVSSKVFCEATNGPVTCFSFLQP
uniref:Ground-like domain-containing protein n=1 Tax=Globodera rostochiensis TaxID=31243 RepID=A0A914GSJ2_GLORO